jgi:hypothetical protein
MQVTSKSVILDTTHMVRGCLEQGGLSGRRVAYPLPAVLRVTGMDADALRQARPEADCPGYTHCSIRDVIEQSLSGRVIRRGHLIA